MGKLGEQITVVAIAIIGLATIAVLVSNRANTANVFGALGNAFNQSLGAAVRPVVSGSSL